MMLFFQLLSIQANSSYASFNIALANGFSVKPSQALPNPVRQ
jgi:hypothetical protein